MRGTNFHERGSMMTTARLTAAVVSLGALLATSAAINAQEFPSKTIRIVAGAAGGGGDFAARHVAQGIAPAMGQPVIVENKSSAVESAETVAKAAPDGYTMLVQGASLWTSGLLQKFSYDVIRDFAPVTMISREVFIVAVHPSVPVKSMQELIKLAKSRPGQLDYASGTIGGPPHLGAELIKSMAGIDMLRVPYKSTAPAVVGVIGGEAHLAVADVPLIMPHTRSNKLRALAVTSPDASPLAPGLPTVAASGLPGYEVVGGSGIWAPAKTPSAIIAKLNQEMVRALNQPAAKERLLATQVETVANSPEQFAAHIKTDLAKWAKVIKEAGIKVN
jgi:tripartite-type tricarboxylate transporter receptor subunit TctC